MSQEPQVRSPSKKAVLWSVVAAAIAAAVLLVVVVLPSEYGVDPTGIGGALGLTALSNDEGSARTVQLVDVIGGNEVIREVAIPDPGEPTPLPNPAVHQDEAQPPRTETLEITIGAEQQTEVKTVLRQGKMVVYSWEVDQGEIYVDYHGHDPALGDDFWVRYKEQDGGSGSHGSLVAPFDGEHGWYWLNYNDFPVVVTLTVTGYYEDIIDYGIF
jgi:hypothetical protein